MISRLKIGVLAFVLVLLFMPLGHTLMVLVEQVFEQAKFLSAFVVGLIGAILLIVGVKKNSNKSLATVLGLIAGVLVWTGWIEFSFVWIAQKLEVAPLMENGEVATKPEYLVMLSSLGLLVTFMLLFLFSKTGCQFFNWFQRVLGLRKSIVFKGQIERPEALVTLIELIMIVWTFYLVLLLVYDKDIAGDNHPLTYLVAFGSLLWSIYLFLKLIRIKKFNYAIKYAIPTVVIFWNFIEVMGRWNLLKEIWIHPFEHWIEVSMIFGLLVFLVVVYIKETRKEDRLRSVRPLEP